MQRLTSDKTWDLVTQVILGHTWGDFGTMSMLFFDSDTKLGRIMILTTNFSDKKVRVFLIYGMRWKSISFD